MPIAFNTHFVITFGYWISRIAFGMTDFITEDPEYSKAGEEFWASLVHGWPLLLLLGDLRNIDTCPYYGTRQDLVWSYAWILGWALFVYLPWRQRTGDPVYSIMSDKVPIAKRIAICGFMISLITVSNSILWYLR